MGVNTYRNQFFFMGSHEWATSISQMTQALYTNLACIVIPIFINSSKSVVEIAGAFLLLFGFSLRYVLVPRPY